MSSFISFTDDELEATLPTATAVYHVDAASSGIPGHVSKVDWAWDEPTRHFLCEFKDPECVGALAHNAGATARMQAELAGSKFPGELAEKAYQTVQHYQPTATTTAGKVYVVMVAISALTPAEMGTAGLVIEGQLARLGCPMPAIVVNIDEWNTQLAPREMARI